MTKINNQYKKDLLNREYSNVIDTLIKEVKDPKTLTNLETLKQKLENVNNEYNSKKMTVEKYYSEINTIVMQIVNIIIDIEKADKEDDLDFFEQLNKSLVLNLIKEDIDKLNEHVQKQSQTEFKDKNSLFKYNDDVKKIAYLRNKIDQLHELERKYEKILNETTDFIENQKYKAIIEGIRSQIYLDTKQLQQLTSQNNP